MGPLKVCIIGSGPAGFYTAKYLLKKINHVKIDVDMVEKLPTPFGLIRSGVAPDHQDVKAVQNDFKKVASDPRFKFFGNVTVGADIDFAELKSLYDVIVVAHGAANDRHLKIPGSHLHGVISARSFVNWYNGYPDCFDSATQIENCLKQSNNVVIIGVGNVALDCARILLKDSAELKDTDIATNAWSVLSSMPQERKVTIAGRRSHLQAKFTLRELKDVIRLKGVDFSVRLNEIMEGRNYRFSEVLLQDRRVKKLDEILYNAALQYSKNATTTRKHLELRFLLSPRTIKPMEQNLTQAVGIFMERNSFADDDLESFELKPMDHFEFLKCGLIITCIGYKSQYIDGIPFDHDRGTVLCEENNNKVYGVGGAYSVGWARRGSTGTIATNIIDAKGVADTILQDIESNIIFPTWSRKRNEGIVRLLENKKIQYVTWSDFLLLDMEEKFRGQLKGKPREKMLTVHEMLSFVRESQSKEGGKN